MGVSDIYDHIDMVCLPNGCWITFEHAVLVDQESDRIADWDTTRYTGICSRLDSDEIAKYGLRWALPKHLLAVQKRYQDKIYNFVLDSNHTVNVNGNCCCTLGHDDKGAVIEHEFWGNSRVITSHLKASSSTYP